MIVEVDLEGGGIEGFDDFGGPGTTASAPGKHQVALLEDCLGLVEHGLVLVEHGLGLVEHGLGLVEHGLGLVEGGWSS